MKKAKVVLPENAHRILKAGEVYSPIVLADDTRSEVTLWSIGLGVGMVMIFTMACVYIALRAGNGIEASVPIATLAIFLSRLRKSGTTILENVMVQSVGQAAGVVAAGATFVIPALYINQQPVTWWQIFLACFIGGVFGTVLIIPLRRYFVRELHGQLPFPEGKAITEVIVAGDSSASEAGKILILSFLVGAGFDFLIEAIHLWNSDLTTSALPVVGSTLEGLHLEVKITGIAALFGLGFLIGPKFAAMIAAGSVLAYLVLVPLIFMFGNQIPSFEYAGATYKIAEMSSGKIFGAFVKPIGIGAIAIGGLIGIIGMGKVVISSFSLGFKGFSKKQVGEDKPRTDLDMSPRNILMIQILAALAMGIIFFVVAMITPNDKGITYSVGKSLLFAITGMGVGYVLCFLFTPVAAQAIAIMGVNPVSGMTLIAVVLSILSLAMVGVGGNAGMILALIVGTTICTALSTSGAFISDLKVGYWIGSTPRNQQRWKFLGVLVAALVVAFVIPLMDQAYSFVILDPATGQFVANDQVLPAPQANMIAAVSKGIIKDPANQPWLLYGLGGIMSFLLFMASIPSILAFALGVYLPIGINMSVLAGAICAWIIGKTGGKKEVREARARQADLIAAGLIAGAAIFGIGTAVLRLPDVGAPIQHISVGVKYEVVALVDGKSVKGKAGKALASCDKVKLRINQSCDEQLRPQKDGTAPWFDNWGRLLGLVMLFLLGLACFGLSRKGAKWELASRQQE